MPVRELHEHPVPRPIQARFRRRPPVKIRHIRRTVLKACADEQRYGKEQRDELVDYRVDGLRFSRPGWWNVAQVIVGRGGVDSVAFNMIVPSRSIVPLVSKGSGGMRRSSSVRGFQASIRRLFRRVLIPDERSTD